MKSKKSRSAAWAMINWAVIEYKIKKETTILPDHTSIQAAISEIEKKFTEEELFLKEAEELENLLISKIIKQLEKTRGKEIKHNKMRLEKKRNMRKKGPRVGVKVMPLGSLKDLKDLGLDQDTMEELSKNIMDQLSGKRKKDSDDDEDEEDDPGASFYL